MNTVSLFFNTRYTLQLSKTYIECQMTNYVSRYNFNYRDIFDIVLIIVLTAINPVFSNAYNVFIFILYWFILGLLSTIGFGFGLQTGVLFMLPYILHIHNVSTDCLNTEFAIIGSDKYKCLSDTIDPYLRLSIFFKCVPAVFIWASGSALGELPPFLIAKYTETDNNTDVLMKDNSFMMRQIEKCIKKYRFLTVLLFASWPNVTFDMCGLMCGYYNFSLKEFLIPTFIGKVFIKASGQLFLIVYFYSEEYSLENKTTVNTIWNSIATLIITYFIKSFIETCANKQKDIYTKAN